MLLAIVAGVTMGLFYRFVAESMASDFVRPEPGRLGPYSAIVVFAVGLFLSSFLWNSVMDRKPSSRRWAESWKDRCQSGRPSW